MTTIYMRTNLINGKKYIGKTKDLEKRNYNWKCIKHPYSGKVITEDRDKYGLENFKLDILIECDDNEGDKWEKYFIEVYNTVSPNGYNMTGGGSDSFQVNDEMRKKRSEDRILLYQDEKERLKQRDRLLNHPKKSKPVVQINPDGNVVEFPSTREAGRNGYNQHAVNYACNGKLHWIGNHKYRGSEWWYKDEYEKMLAEQPS